MGETFVIYTSGNIAGVTDDEARGWRNAVKEFFALRELPVKVLDPCRGHVDLKKRYEPKEIVARDLRDIDMCDIMLVRMEVGPGAHGIGTSMEIMYAYLAGKPIFFVSANKPLVEYYWIEPFITRGFSELSVALEYILEYWI